MSFPRTLQNLKLSILSILFILFILKLKFKKIYVHNLIKLTLIYLLPFLIAIIYKNDTNYIFDALKLYIFFPFLIYSILQLYDIRIINNYILKTAIISIIIIVFITITTILNAIGVFPVNLNLIFYPDEDNIGFNVGYLHIINSQLSYLIFLIPIVFYKRLNFRFNEKNFLFFLALLIFCFLTGRRILMLPFLLIFILNFKKIINFSISLIIIFTLLLNFNFFEIDLIVIWERFIDAISSRGDSEARGEQIIQFFDYIKSKPIFGYGLGSYMKNYLRNYEYKTAYEITYLYYLFTFGLVSTFILVLYYTKLFFRAYNSFLNIKIENKMGLLLGIFSILLASLTNPYWLSSFDYCLPFALLIRFGDNSL